MSDEINGYRLSLNRFWNRLISVVLGPPVFYAGGCQSAILEKFVFLGKTEKVKKLQRYSNRWTEESIFKAGQYSAVGRTLASGDYGLSSVFPSGLSDYYLAPVLSQF